MAAEHRATYLNVHMAGAIAALELLEHLESSYAGSEKAREFGEIRSDIAADRGELKALMDRLQVTQSAPRKAAAWLTGKMVELKLRLDDRATGPLRLLETVERWHLELKESSRYGAHWRLRPKSRPRSAGLTMSGWRAVLKSSGAVWKHYAWKRRELLCPELLAEFFCSEIANPG